MHARRQTVCAGHGTHDRGVMMMMMTSRFFVVADTPPLVNTMDSNARVFSRSKEVGSEYCVTGFLCVFVLSAPNEDASGHDPTKVGYCGRCSAALVGESAFLNVGWRAHRLIVFEEKHVFPWCHPPPRFIRRRDIVVNSSRSGM